LARPGVLVQATLPDMPAEKILKVGDVIEQLDGVSLTSSNDLAEALQTRPPGHEVKLVVLRTERDAQARPLVGADGKPVERRLEFNVALGDASNLDRFDAMEARAMGLPNNMAMNRANLPLQQRAWQAASIAQRFSAKPGPVVVPEGTPGSAVPQPPVVAPPADREP
jgi:PDZ domain